MGNLTFLGPIGLAALVVGASLRFAVGRARFFRRNPFGLMVFRTYRSALVFRAGTAAADWIGWLLLALGSLVFVAALLRAGR